MISVELMLYCFVAAGVYLVLVSVLLEMVARGMKLSTYIPSEFREEQTVGWYATFFVMDYLFFVVIPTFAYSFFYLILPLSGIRVGMAVALLAFVLGMAPTMMGFSLKVKFPMPYLLYFLVSMLVKVSGSLIIIGYLYTL